MSKCIFQSSLGDWKDAGGCSIISPSVPEAAEEFNYSAIFISITLRLCLYFAQTPGIVLSLQSLAFLAPHANVVPLTSIPSKL